MGVTMQESRMKELAAELAKGLKTPADLSHFTAQLTKLTVEAALNAEMSYHLGYGKHEVKGRNTGNSRNGYTKKILKGTHGEIELETPRDREGSFEPCLVAKNQTRITGMDNQILSLYAKGMSTRDIAEAFHEMYSVEVSAGLISQVTNAVIDQVNEWQNRPLDKIYPIVYLDCITIKIRENKQVINKAIYLALGVNMEGHKELLGMWISVNEGGRIQIRSATPIKSSGQMR